MAERAQLKALPWHNNYADEPRRFGIEIEFSGLELVDITQQVASHLELNAEPAGRYRYKFTGDKAGDWLLELDFQLLNEMGQQKFDSDSLTGNLQESLETVLAAIAKKVVPLELVTPPLPYARLGEVVSLITMLHQAGAKGSSESLHYAFGLQLNPEIPTKDVAVLRRVIQAFICLQDWLRQREKIDLVRSLTSFIEPYPAAYQRKITDEHYQPTLSTLIDDYLEYNPTRNRALDCLPLFLHLDEKKVRAVTDDKLIKARPAFHYRLPSCEIHLPGWDLQHAWDGWAEVEMLAADTPRLQRCMAAYQQHLARLGSTASSWIKQLEKQWLNR